MLQDEKTDGEFEDEMTQQIEETDTESLITRESVVEEPKIMHGEEFQAFIPKKNCREKKRPKITKKPECLGMRINQFVDKMLESIDVNPSEINIKSKEIFKLGLRPRKKNTSSTSSSTRIPKKSYLVKKLPSLKKFTPEQKEKLLKEEPELFKVCVFLNSVLAEKKKYALGIEELLWIYVNSYCNLELFKEKVLNGDEISQHFGKIRI